MKVLIVRLSAIGDVIQGIPCLVALKRSFPDWKISWLVEETSASILEGHPCLDRLFILKRSWRKSNGNRIPRESIITGVGHFLSVSRDIRAEKFDVAIDLQGLLKSAIWMRLSGARRRIGFEGTREGASIFANELIRDHPEFDPSFPLVERYLLPALKLGAKKEKGIYELVPSSDETRKKVETWIPRDGKPVIALCPWSLWPSKNWPLDAWISLAKKLSSSHRLLLIGGSDNIREADKVQSQVSGLTSLVGKTSFPELSEIFRKCKVVVGPDSGPLHLANATHLPRIVMIFGSTSWKRSGPVGKQHQSLSKNLSCQPCFKRQCPLHHMNCLHGITVDEVFHSIVEPA